VVWFVTIKLEIGKAMIFEFAEFTDAIEFIKLWEQGCTGSKCDYQIKRSDI
jgi:hypothetical protein